MPLLGVHRGVGWSMQPTLSRDLVMQALLAAVWRRRPTGPVLVHGDQGGQYGSQNDLAFLAAHGLDPSMSRKGNCLDNAVPEGFFSAPKKLRIRRQVYATWEETRADIFEFIELFYDAKRRHSHVGGVSPQQFEADRAASLQGAGRPWEVHCNQSARRDRGQPLHPIWS